MSLPQRFSRPILLCLTLTLASPLIVSAAEDAADADPWVARKGGSQITLQDIDAQLDGLQPAIRAGMMDDPKRIEKLIEDLLLNRQMADMARSKGLDQGPLHARKIRLAEDRFLSQEFADNMQHDVGAKELETLARERYLLSSPSVYGGTDEKRDLQHILIAYDGRTPLDAKALAEDIHARLLRGEGFDDLAMTYSADKARVDDLGLPKPPGLLMAVGRGDTDPDFERVAFAMKRTGDLSEPVQSAHGFHIIKLLRVQKENRLPFDEVRHLVIADTATWLTRKKRDDTIADLRSLPVEGNKEIVASLRTRYATATEEPSE